MRKLDYKSKVVVLSGASSGIGKSLATELIKKHNCLVFGIARNEQRLNAVKNELGENFVPFPFDVSNNENWLNFADFLKNSGLRVDILINCAGILPSFSDFENAELCDFEMVMDINYFSQVYACKALIPYINDLGAIVNISSSSSLCPFATVGSYCASKSASTAFSICLAHELKRVSVSAVMPGFVKTDIMKNQANLNSKEKSLIDKFSANPTKVAKRILRRVGARKKRIVVGIDAHLMSFLYRFFPRLGPKIISSFLKNSGLELFK